MKSGEISLIRTQYPMFSILDGFVLNFARNRDKGLPEKNVKFDVWFRMLTNALKKSNVQFIFTRPQILIRDYIMKELISSYFHPFFTFFSLLFLNSRVGAKPQTPTPHEYAWPLISIRKLKRITNIYPISFNGGLKLCFLMDIPENV